MGFPFRAFRVFRSSRCSIHHGFLMNYPAPSIG